MQPLMLFPVWGFGNPRQPVVAEFFTWSDAVDFINHVERRGFEKQTLYIGEPRYDRRASGYRFTPLTDVRQLGEGRIAA